MINNTEKLRKYNTNKIKKHLKFLEFGTKSSLATLTGLSVATCGNILSSLINSGEVIELELSVPNGGRPSRRFKYNVNFSFNLNIFLRKENGIEYIHVSLKNLANTSVFEDVHAYKQLIYSNLDGVISALSEKYNIGSIVLAVPGVVKNGYIYSCDIDTLKGINILELIQNKFKVLTMVENDVNVLAYGSLANNSFDITSSSVYLYFPELGKPGMGMVINGRVIFGHNNFAGEIKDLPIEGVNTDVHDLQADAAVYQKYIQDIVRSVNAIINPTLFTISCSNVSKNFETLLTKKLKQIENIGTVNIESDIHDTMLLGLNYLSNMLINEV